MAEWSPAQLAEIESHAALYVAPFREDGITYGTPTETWALVVDGKVYVRAATGVDSRWYQAAITQRAGRVSVDDTVIEVTFEAAGNDDETAIDAAYEAKYATHDESYAIEIMQGAGPKKASVRIWPL